MIEDINDKEDIRLILDYKRAMAMDKVPLPNMEEERKRFWEKQKQVRPSSHEMQQSVNVKMLRLKRWCIAASVAAVLFSDYFWAPSFIILL